MARSTFANYFATTLTAGINGTDVNADVVTTGTLSAPCYIVIRPRDPANREVWYATTVTSTRFTVSSTSDRYLAGSAKSSGQTHPTDAEVWCVPLGQHLDDLWDAVDAKASDSHDNTEHSTDFATQADFSGHTATTDAHSATDAATASRIVLRDANGRAKVADPSADADIATKGWAEGLFEQRIDEVGPLGAAQASIPFTSIPQTYTHLRIVFQASHNGTGFIDMLLRVNGDSGASDYRMFRESKPGDGSTPSRQTGAGSGIRMAVLSNASSGLAPATIEIPDYTNTSVRRSFHCGGGCQNGTAAGDFRHFESVGWRDNGAAITSIELTMLGGDSFVAGSIFTLYGLP